jgi:YVTN family beta-propeller protein
MHRAPSSKLILSTILALGAITAACDPADKDDEGAGGHTGGAPGGTPAGGAAAGGASGGGGTAGAPAEGGEAPPVAASTRKTPTNGSAVAVTADDRYAVAANRTAGRVTVFKLEFGGAYPATKLVDLDVGKKAEPWAVVIGNDDDTAYVILRKEEAVLRVRGLHGSPHIDELRAPTGSEPTGIAISPTGASLYVANWGEGTVTVIDTASLTVKRTVDLNASLAASGMLGLEVEGRPGLAHPRALVVTNDGDTDDSDERLYVTEFFSQARTDTLPEDDSRFDVGRQGVVYRVSMSDYAVAKPITIAPVADTGFVDSRGQTTGCFPNQLYAAAINSQRLYLTSVCESPRGPVGPDAAPVAPGVASSNFKTQVHGAIFVVDLATDEELPAQGLLLTRAFDKLYSDLKLPDDGSRRMPLIPNDIMFAAGSTFAYVTGYGADAVFRIAYKADGSVERVGADAQPFIDLKPGGAVAAGELPIGVASANAGASKVPFAVALNENSRNLSVLAFGTQTVKTAVAATDPPAPGLETATNRGQKFFSTGLGRWSLNAQAWNSCAACHPDGLSDNVTWYFGRGPRQTTSLDGSYDPKNPNRRRVLNWTGINDELHDFEGNTRGNSGGVGAVVHRSGPPITIGDRIIFEGTPPAGDQLATPTPQAGLNGSVISLMPKGNANPKSVQPDWDEIEEYVRAVRAPRAPTNLVASDVAEGKKLFEANGCAACHGGTQWTISNVFYTPNEENNKVDGLLRTTFYQRPALFPEALNPPSAGAAMGKAPLRFTGANPAANDQINCVLRDVGTFPAMGTTAIAPAGVLTKEVRQDMTTLAQGLTGFNIPSLLGMVTGAPYFHGGAARTLEEAFGETFDRHRRAFAENFRPDADQVRQLVAYLLSIDEDAAPAPAPWLGFPFDLCAEIPAGIIK